MTAFVLPLPFIGTRIWVLRGLPDSPQPRCSMRFGLVAIPSGRRVLLARGIVEYGLDLAQAFMRSSAKRTIRGRDRLDVSAQCEASPRHNASTRSLSVRVASWVPEQTHSSLGCILLH
jgi:hypothetical protein